MRRLLGCIVGFVVACSGVREQAEPLANDAATVSSPCDKPGTTVFCTMEYDPAECTLTLETDEGTKILRGSGGNRCKAQISMRKEFCRIRDKIKKGASLEFNPICTKALGTIQSIEQ